MRTRIIYKQMMKNLYLTEEVEGSDYCYNMNVYVPLHIHFISN